MKSSVIKRSIVISGHKTSVSLEDAFWQGLRDIAQVRGGTLSSLVGEIDTARRHNNLSSAIRLFVLDWMRAHVSQPAVQPRDAMTIRSTLPRHVLMQNQTAAAASPLRTLPK